MDHISNATGFNLIATELVEHHFTGKPYMSEAEHEFDDLHALTETLSTYFPDGLNYKPDCLIHETCQGQFVKIVCFDSEGNRVAEFKTIADFMAAVAVHNKTL